MRTLLSLGIVVVFLAFASTRLMAQAAVAPKPEQTVPEAPSTDTIPHDMVVVNLGGLTTEFLHAAYYHALADDHAIGLLLGMIYYPLGHGNVTGYAGVIAYRYYPGHRALWRFYVSPQVGYQGVAVSRDTTAGGPMIAGMVGWQWFPVQSFAVGVGFGVRYVFGGSEVASAALQKTLGFRPGVVLDLGYGW